MIKHKIQLLIMALTLTFSLVTHAETIEGRVVGVSDGDTLTMLDAGNTQFKIRLAAIDAPEKVQAFGQRGKEQLSDICYGKQASVTVVDTDRYGRTVGEVVCDGTYANEAMIKSGLAWVYRKYAKGYGHLYAFEDEAKTAKRGLWADPNPTTPWEWRKAKRNH
jgi:micrococcal nuclease